jgi:chemotaxis protein methyltransferase CheR
MVEFHRFNIHTGDWQRFQGADLIFCRNTIIYFTQEARDQAVRNMVACLRPGGFLVLGHTEIIDGPAFGMRRVASTAYRKDRA